MKAPQKVIEIAGKKHLLTFGLGMLREVGKVYPHKAEGLEMQGMQYIRVITELNMRNPSFLADLIRFTLSPNDYVEPQEIEEYIFEIMEDEEEMDKVFDDFLESFMKVPGAKRYRDLSNKKKDEPKKEEEAEKEVEEVPSKPKTRSK